MKLIVIYDSNGAIVSTATMRVGGLRPSIQNLPAGHREVELDADHILEDMSDHEVHRQLDELSKRFDVDLSQSTPVLRERA